MGERRGRVAISGFLHRHFLWLLVAAYVLAGVAPEFGCWLSRLAGTTHVFGQAVRVSAPAAMLGILLFAAGFAVRAEHLRGVVRRPLALAVGLAASVAVPVLVLIATSPLLTLWHDPAEARDLVVGLAVVAAMPVAGSSAGWSRAADGDCALSLGLVLFSTLLSPITTPLALDAATAFVPGDARRVLSHLAGVGGAGAFVVAWVVMPTCLGLLCRCGVGGRRADAVGPWMKLWTSAILLAAVLRERVGLSAGRGRRPGLGLPGALVDRGRGDVRHGVRRGFTAARSVRADRRGGRLVFGGHGEQWGGAGAGSGCVGRVPAGAVAGGRDQPRPAPRGRVGERPIAASGRSCTWHCSGRLTTSESRRRSGPGCRGIAPADY